MIFAISWRVMHRGREGRICRTTSSSRCDDVRAQDVISVIFHLVAQLVNKLNAAATVQHIF